MGIGSSSLSHWSTSAGGHPGGPVTQGLHSTAAAAALVLGMSTKSTSRTAGAHGKGYVSHMSRLTECKQAHTPRAHWNVRVCFSGWLSQCFSCWNHHAVRVSYMHAPSKARSSQRMFSDMKSWHVLVVSVNDDIFCCSLHCRWLHTSSLSARCHLRTSVEYSVWFWNGLLCSVVLCVE